MAYLGFILLIGNKAEEFVSLFEDMVIFSVFNVFVDGFLH
jgi:hypothetical protein